jgi:sorting nexin-7/30/sorting nexin-8
MKEKNENENEKKYDISKSNFFANIPESNISQQKNEIKTQTMEILNTPDKNTENINISNINNINNANNITNNNTNNITNSSYQNNYFPPENYYSNYLNNQMNNQYQNQQINYQNSMNYYPAQNIPSPQSPSFLQKMSETAMNLIKKDDPLNLIMDINPKFLDDLITKSKKEIKSPILQKSKISNIEIKSIISNPRKINESLVKNSYLLYDITTPKMNWYVNRRYSDFLWLREILSSMFPTILLPQLPKKKIGNRRFENDFVEKRIKGLQDFLDEILKNEIIKTAEPLISFLSLTERGFFEQQMKILTPKILNIDNIGSIASFEGKIEVADMEDEQYNNNKNYFNSVETFFNLSAEEIKNIKSNLKEYNINMILASQNLEQVENGFSRLNQFYNKANLAKDICNVFEQYQIFFKNWKRLQINQTEIIRKKLNNYFNYIRNKGNSLVELIKKQNELQSDYNKMKENLLNKKENLWKKMEINKWEMNQMTQIDSVLLFRDKNYAFSKMCFQETMNLNNKGDLLGYYYINNILNIKNVLANIEKYSVDNLVDFSKEIEPTVTDVVNVWSNLASNL